MVERPAPYAASHRVLVVGDVMLDESRFGAVARVAPEAPVPVLVRERVDIEAGGAARVAIALATLAVEPIVVGLVGEDAESVELRRILDRAGIDAGGLVSSSARPTTKKTRLYAGRNLTAREDVERVALASGEEERGLIAAIEAARGAFGAIVISDYAKGVVTPAVLAAVGRRARLNHCPVIADPKSPDLARYGAVTFLTPNERELRSADGASGSLVSPLEEEAIRVLDRLSASWLLVTCGHRGSLFVERGRSPEWIRSNGQVATDAVGAGDVAVAVLASCLGRGVSAFEAARSATLGAELAISDPVRAPVSMRRITAGLRGERQLEQEELLGLLAMHRRRGERVVFTNGCYDLLHAGHVDFLRRARALGDVLVVALNDDASVRRVKGQDRPVIPLAGRAAVVSGLRSVDYVTAFGEDTPLALIERLRPDVLVKGGDYSLDEIVGRREVESWGGLVVALPLFGEASTTRILDHIRTKEAR